MRFWSFYTIILGLSFAPIFGGRLLRSLMMISVLERVRETGILKALGMKDKGVLTLYITEGLLLGLFGSLAGLGLGYVRAYALPIILSGAFSMGGEGGAFWNADWSRRGMEQWVGWG